MADRETFPVDCENSYQGMIISSHELQRITGKKPGTNIFNAKAVELAQEFQKRLWKMGRRWTVAVLKGEVHVLTDDAASEYNAGFFERSRVRMFKANRQMAAVDTSGFDGDDRAKHQRALVVQGAVIAGMSEGRRQIGARAYKRTTPGIESYVG